MKKRIHAAAPIHTIVLHYFPDLEALFMLWLILTFPVVRRHFGFIPGAFNWKVIPSGPLRPEDWKDILPAGTLLSAKELGKLGYLFVDCGGGDAPLDQHGRKENAESNTVTSVDLLVEALSVVGLPKCVLALVVLVSLHDRDGESVARISRKERKHSSLPNTPQDLHMLILGWNLLNLQNVAEVIRLTLTAFNAVFKLVLQADQARIDAGFLDSIVDVKAMNLFTLEQILAGLTLYSEEHADVDVEQFRVEAEKGLRRADLEWSSAMHDFRASSETFDIPATIVRTTAPDKPERVTLKVTVGVSGSHRFGEYCRFHKRKTEELVGQEDHLLHKKNKEDCGCQEDHGADVVVQFSPEPGKYVVSTRGNIDMATVAAALRTVEMNCLGAVPETPLRLINHPGQFYMRRDGERLWPIYFPEFRKAVGNNFRTNPFLPPSVLTQVEIERVVLRTLQGLPPGVAPDENRTLPCELKQPHCSERCPYYNSALPACEAFRRVHYSSSVGFRNAKPTDFAALAQVRVNK